MKKIYIPVKIIFLFLIVSPFTSNCQNCATLQATYISYESRCAATGCIKVHATGGSGSYKYKTTGPVNINFTTSDSITGLSAGVYSLVVNDFVTNCSITINNIFIAGSYQDPRFTLTKLDVSCDNGNNGSITVGGQQFGRAPFYYSIIAPSPMGVGTINSSGIFNNLIAGDYGIQMTDSCGGIQTRRITVNNYTWWIDSYPFTKTACDEASGYIKVMDSRGNISTVTGIPGFMYGIVRQPGDTIWSFNPNFSFPLSGNNNFQVIAKDVCGIIKKGAVTVSLIPVVNALVNIHDFQCDRFSASLTGIVNFFGGDFCLYDNNDIQITCNNSGTFTNIPYGNYCITAHDACADTVITRCFTATPPAIAIDNNVAITNKICTSFNAGITGQVGLTDPQYCLYDSADVLLSCNSSGLFTNLHYSSYCIKTTDGCRDTTIIRCFSPTHPTPALSLVVPDYITCINFGIVVIADSVTNPIYCLYDSNAVLILCNNTGVFDSIPLGNYCVTMHDACTDTTITSCFGVLAPIAQNDINIRTTNKTCNTFSVAATSSSLNISGYCLYDALDVLVICNATGFFTNVPYGSYCIKAAVICPDTILTTCFSVNGPVPSVGAAVAISNTTCTTFTASITSQTNLTNPQFCIYDNSNTLINCNTRGVFAALVYGSYCIKIVNDCYDTIITRCFTRLPVPVSLFVNTGKSCSYGYAQFNIGMGGAVLPVNIIIYNPDGSLLSNANYNNNNITVDSIPGTAPGDVYTIIAVDNCGNRDTARTGATASYFNHMPLVIPKCPGGVWPNGSGNISMTINTNMGSLTVRLIKKNGVAYPAPLLPDDVSGGVYTFSDLGPGTYLLRSMEHTCNKSIYDTVVINNYEYPNLNRSSAYQCDVNGFSISAVATNGVSPYLYEIIGSVPASPSIITGPQTGSVFSINNGSNYSLVRLRVVDACGNATLGDASVLPLAYSGISVTDNCFEHPTVLSVDSFFNASYKWYKKLNRSDTDSTLIDSTSGIFIPQLTAGDTGVYICHMIVNSGCIDRTYYFNLNGLCFIVLPTIIDGFKGKILGGTHLLTWKTSQEQDLAGFIIERKTDLSGFEELGQVKAAGNATSIQQYQFEDKHPAVGNNYYRLKINGADNRFNYSNTIALNKDKPQNNFDIYPNPVHGKLIISCNDLKKHSYKIRITNAMQQIFINKIFITNPGSKLELIRPAGLKKGIYILYILDMETNEEIVEKLVFL